MGCFGFLRAERSRLDSQDCFRDILRCICQVCLVEVMSDVGKWGPRIYIFADVIDSAIFCSKQG